MNHLFLLFSALVALVCAQSSEVVTLTQVRTSVVVATATQTASRGSSDTTRDRATTTSPGSAQTTVSLFNACRAADAVCDQRNDVTYYGGIISANASVTVFSIGCAVPRNRTGCTVAQATVTQGANLYALTQSAGTDASISCTRSSSNSSATCIEIQRQVANGNSVSGSAQATSSVTKTITFANSDIYSEALVITSGVEKLATTGTGSRSGTGSGSATGISAATTTTRSAAATSSAVSFGLVLGLSIASLLLVVA